MALFLVKRKGEKKTIGVYSVVDADKGGAEARFLVWENGTWLTVRADEFEPFEIDNVFSEGEEI